MKLSNKKIRKLIREAIENQITRPDLASRKRHHVYQQGAIPPEFGLDDEELRDHILTVRKSGDKGDKQADEFVDALEHSKEAIFGLPGKTYGDIEKVRSKYDDEFGDGGTSDYLAGTDGFLRISYPMDEIISNHDPSIHSSELNRIIRDSFEGWEGSLGADPYRFKTRIKAYVNNPEHAQERQKIAKAFAGIDYDVVKDQSFEEYLLNSAATAVKEYERDRAHALT